MLLREIREPKVKVDAPYLAGLYQVTMSISITCKWIVCEAQSILILGRSEGMPPSLVALRIDISSSRRSPLRRKPTIIIVSICQHGTVLYFCESVLCEMLNCIAAC